MASAVTQPVPSRARYAVAPAGMQVLPGVVHSWTVFREPLSRAYGWSNAQTIAPCRYSLPTLALGMIVGTDYYKPGRRLQRNDGAGLRRGHARRRPVQGQELAYCPHSE